MFYVHIINCTVCFATSLADQESDLIPEMNENNYTVVRIKDFMLEELTEHNAITPLKNHIDIAQPVHTQHQ